MRHPRVAAVDDEAERSSDDGLAVTKHVSAAGTAHRATTDIDLVTVYVEPAPEVVELIAGAHHSEQHALIVGDVTVDIIPTNAIAASDFEGFEDNHRRFIAGHRWPPRPPG